MSPSSKRWSPKPSRSEPANAVFLDLPSSDRACETSPVAKRRDESGTSCPQTMRGGVSSSTFAVCPAAPVNPAGYYHVALEAATAGCSSTRRHNTKSFFACTSASLESTGGRRPCGLSWGTTHHFVIQLTKGGLSEGMRELHGGFSRWIHALTGRRGRAPLRHAFFARALDRSRCPCRLLATSISTLSSSTREREPGGDPLVRLPPTIGLEHPRPFHTPIELLELISPQPTAARKRTGSWSTTDSPTRGQTSRQTTVVRRG